MSVIKDAQDKKQKMEHNNPGILNPVIIFPKSFLKGEIKTHFNDSM